ncbi:hypothetical protein H4R21_004525 [Coemansia helicoidea]|uniref:Uncharacterized protein n=1 Tax=Coemansia helicoidea TaxID=1286919 RepID=A0ACC1KYF9_9FUNG|nr:hypothetical protein H4R21_004525 [Coemansia helicoidea]
MAVLVRGMSERGYSALQTMLWRSVVQTVCALAACGALGVRPHRVLFAWAELRWVVARAVFGGAGHLLYYAALGRMPLGPATVLFFTNPLFTALLARWLLGERLLSAQWRLMLASLAGVALVVVRPAALAGFEHSAAGPLCALAGALAVAMAYVSVRLAGSRVHAMVHVVYFGIVGAAGCLALSWLTGEEAWRMPAATLADWAVVLGVGVAAFLAQFLMNWGLQLAAAGPVVMMRSSDVVIGFVVDAAVYHTAPPLASTVGAFIVTACVLLMSL